MKICFCVASLVFLAAILVGCGPAESGDGLAPDAGFAELVGMERINRDFEIQAEPHGKVGLGAICEIRLQLHNRSRRDIYFPVGYGIRLFIFHGNRWWEIANNHEYYGEGSVLRPRGEETLGEFLSTGVCPSLPERMTAPDQQYTLRIFMAGELGEDGSPTGVMSSAFTDVQVSPG
jgi:hypothetical protein